MAAAPRTTTVTSDCVLVQGDNLHKAEAAEGTHVGPLVGVNAAVTVEVGDMGEALVARLAGEVAHTLVDGGHVALVFVWFVETLLTHLADVWRHPQVNLLLVVAQAALLLKAGRAAGALPGPPRVQLGMARKLTRSGQQRSAIRVAAAKGDIFVLAKMAVQLGYRGELPVTEGAGVLRPVRLAS